MFNKLVKFYQKISPQKLAFVFLLCVASGYAFTSIVIRILDTVFQPLTQVYVRLGFGALAATFLLRKRIDWQKLTKIKSGDLGALLIMGIIGYGLTSYFMTLGALNTKLVNITVVYATVTIFTYFYNLIVFRKKFNFIIFLYICLSLLGVAIMATKSLIPNLKSFSIGEIYVLLGAATGAWYYVGRKMVSSRLNNSEVTLLVLYFSFITAFIMAQVSGEKFIFSSFINPIVLVGLTLGSIFNVIAALFENYSFKQLDVVIGSQILLFSNIFALVFGYILYHEVLKLPEIIGAAIVIFSVFRINKLL